MTRHAVTYINIILCLFLALICYLNATRQWQYSYEVWWKPQAQQSWHIAYTIDSAGISERSGEIGNCADICIHTTRRIGNDVFHGWEYLTRQ